MTFRADPTLLGNGIVDNSQNWFPSPGQGDQSSIDGETSNKSFGSIDRIDNPDEFSVQSIRAVLFTENSVIRKKIDYAFAQGSLNRSISLRDWTEIGFVIGPSILYRSLHQYGSGQIREICGEFGKCVKLVSEHWRTLSFLWFAAQMCVTYDGRDELREGVWRAISPKPARDRATQRL